MFFRKDPPEQEARRSIELNEESGIDFRLGAKKKEKSMIGTCQPAKNLL
jgi:hypothetical protein